MLKWFFKSMTGAVGEPAFVMRDDEVLTLSSNDWLEIDDG
jgi:hypothetical protein